MCSPISSLLSAHMAKLPKVLRVQDKLLKKMRPAMLTTIMRNEPQIAETGITPPPAEVSSPDRTVRIAITGNISKTESNKLKIKAAMSVRRSFPEKSSNRFISRIMRMPPLLYPLR